MGDKYGGIFSVKLGDHFAIFISDYNIMKEALMKQGSCFSHRPSTALDRAIGYDEPGVVLANGRVWQVFRRFAMQSMRDFGVGKKSIERKIQIEASSLIQQWRKW
uniref:Cytochrome P450 n=1 Tax=Capitella teleta TaxID=283909 RepID=X2B6P7_CAPTE